MNRNLYLFDFDGTLTNKDSLFDFLKFSFPLEYKKNFIIYSTFYHLKIENHRSRKCKRKVY